jgi:S-adenosylmethionine hydrolase
MNILTLTTDFGQKDYYAAMLKGRILSYGMPVQFVDVSHRVSAFNIVEAAYMVRNVYSSFPKGSVHLLSVHNFYDANPRFLAVFKDGHYFIAADNGIFSLLFPEQPDFMYELPLSEEEEPSLLDMQLVFAKAVAHIFQGKPFPEIGKPTHRCLQRIALQPITGKDYIRAAVVHVDVYENVILNVDRELFDRIAQGRSFELYFKRFDPISQLSKNYAEVPIGEVLCLFNSSGLLEIAVNLGKAASLFGLRVDDTVQLDFLD